MKNAELRDALDVLLGADPDCAERDDLAEWLDLSRRLHGWHNRFDMQCARRARHLAAAGKAEPAESMLGRQGQRSNKEAKKVADRERVGESMASLEDALGDGVVSAGHLDAIAAATKDLDNDTRAKFAEHETDLLAKAASESVDVFGRRCRQLARQLVAAGPKSDVDELDRQQKRSKVKRWVDQITGMHMTRLELDPVRDAKLWSIIDAQLAKGRQADGNSKTPWNQLQIEAFIAAVEAGLNNDDTDSPNNGGNGGRGDAGRRVPEITVLVDWKTLISGLHDNSVCETENGIPLPVSTVRRLCCDAEVLPAVLGGDGEVLDVGRSKRTANRYQRRALRAMHRTCAHPDCTIGFSACRIHHIRWWWKHRGPTDINNLLPLCEKHHHLVHEGRWSLTMTADRVTTWTRPDGIIAHTASSIDRTPDTAEPAPTTSERKPTAA